MAASDCQLPCLRSTRSRLPSRPERHQSFLPFLPCSLLSVLPCSSLLLPTAQAQSQRQVRARVRSRDRKAELHAPPSPPSPPPLQAATLSLPSSPAHASLASSGTRLQQSSAHTPRFFCVTHIYWAGAETSAPTPRHDLHLSHAAYESPAGPTHSHATHMAVCA